MLPAAFRFESRATFEEGLRRTARGGLEKTGVALSETSSVTSQVPNVKPPRRPLVRIQPTRGWAALHLRELWVYRELLYFLVWRDVMVRYRQTVLGALWAIIQPVASMAVFSLFFHTLADVPSERAVPYPLFVYCGLLPWQLFARGVTQASGGVLNSAALIRKVYFPRVLIPVAASLSPLVDFLFAALVLVALLVFYRFLPTAGVLLLPLLVLLTLVTINGIGLWLAAASVRYRDVSILVPFLVQLWLFVTPVIYPSSVLSEPWRTLYGLNPMVGVVEGFRWAILGTAPPSALIALSVVVALALFVSGLAFFRRTERHFADLL